jgi:hypothetical protein
MKKSLIFFGTMTKDLLQFAMSARWATAIRDPEKDIRRFINMFYTKVNKIKKSITKYETNHQLTVHKFATMTNKYLNRIISDVRESNIKKLQKFSKRKLRKMSKAFRKCTNKCIAGKDLASDLRNVRCNAKCARTLIKKL